jgi:hypothetical protein
LVDFQETSSQEPLKGLNWTSLPRLVKFCWDVLKKKMKMLFPIGFHCKLWPPLVAILDFQMAQTVTTHVKDIHRNIYTRFQFNPFSGSWEEVSWKSTKQNLHQK